MTDKEIIDRLKRGDESGVQLIYVNCLPIARSWLANKGCSEVDTKDIFQESMMVLMLKVKEGIFELRSKLCTFLISVCKYTFFKQVRDDPNTEELSIYNKGEIELPDFDVPDGSMLDFIDQLLEGVGEKCQRMIILRFWEGTKWDDLYSELGYSSPHSARQQFSKCLERLRDNTSPVDLEGLK